MSLVCTALAGFGAPLPPPACGSISTGIDQPQFDYDGELDYAFGGATLFVRTGDGVTACYGWPSVGHHTSTIYMQDVVLGAVAFTVTSDYSRAGFEQTPECGDLILEPCSANPPPPSQHPFPVNVVLDTVAGITYTIFGPGGAGCNPLDNVQSCPVSSWPSGGTGPTGCMVTFGDGADGSYMVMVGRSAAPAPGGHVWTS